MEGSRFGKTPPRLRVVFRRDPLYFITLNTFNRRAILASHAAHEVFKEYARIADQQGVSVGRYVIMPDHLHFFVRFQAKITLGRWVAGLKRQLSEAIPPHGLSSDAADPVQRRNATHWQPGFFDHLMRTDESYAEKWEYVRKNPERAGLVDRAEDWPFQGTIVQIDRV